MVQLKVLEEIDKLIFEGGCVLHLQHHGTGRDTDRAVGDASHAERGEHGPALGFSVAVYLI